MESPTEHILVKSVLNASRRILGKPVTFTGVEYQKRKEFFNTIGGSWGGLQKFKPVFRRNNLLCIVTAYPHDSLLNLVNVFANETYFFLDIFASEAWSQLKNLETAYLQDYQAHCGKPSSNRKRITPLSVVMLDGRDGKSGQERISARQSYPPILCTLRCIYRVY